MDGRSADGEARTGASDPGSANAGPETEPGSEPRSESGSEPGSEPSSEPGSEVHHVLRTILAREAARMQDRREELRESRSQLLGLAERLTATSRGEWPPTATTPPAMTPPVPPDRLLELLRDLSVAIAGPMRLSIQRFPPNPVLRQQLSGLVSDVPGTKRAVLPVTLLHEEGARDWLASRALAGEEQRFTHDPVGQYLVIGDQAVLASARWGDPASGFVLVRDPMLVRAFTSLFDISWARGLPDPIALPPGDDRSAVPDGELVALLAEGLKDEAIARYLGVSLRTVRRRVARLMEVLQAHTRFQLGLAVAQIQGGTTRPQVGSGPAHR